MAAPFTFEAARACVLASVSASVSAERVSLGSAAGRVLAEEIRADRPYPPFPRATRDGFALRAAELGSPLRIAGEIRAGQPPAAALAPGECMEIMTGAPVPRGADAVLMVEHASVSGSVLTTDRRLQSGDNIVPEGAETAAGTTVLTAGTRLDFRHIAMLATVGANSVSIYRKPTVAILATGDEIVPIDAAPLAHQIRNSNSYSLAAQITAAGGEPHILPVARDDAAATRTLVEEGLNADLLLLSGGVSAGKYDLVEPVLADLGARFYFTRVLIQPGQPLVFGEARGKHFFGLPGNPASTMVTFAVFARAAVQLLGGEKEPKLTMFDVPLAVAFAAKPGLRRFLPALLSPDGRTVTPIPWQGSGDVSALARATALLVTDPQRESWEKGETIAVLLP